ncbi:hypothetical protein CAJAP_08450 [Camponotus japonicus]
MNDYNNFNVTILRQELRRRELYTGGDKVVLVLRLNAHDKKMIEDNELKERVTQIEQELKTVKEELNSIKQEKDLLQKEVESVKRKCDSIQRNKELPQQDFQDHNYRPMQRQDQSTFLSSEVQPSTSRVTSTSRDMSHEFNRRSNYDRLEESRHHGRTGWQNQSQYNERSYMRRERREKNERCHGPLLGDP